MNLVVALFALIVCCGGVRAVVLEVGGSERWAVPVEGDMYNRWASNKTFQVGDALRFIYKNDSVLEVSQEDYEKCYNACPIRAYYGQRAYYKLRFSGRFYFISGKLGHCELGQRMAIQVKPSEMDGCFTHDMVCPVLNVPNKLGPAWQKPRHKLIRKYHRCEV